MDPTRIAELKVERDASEQFALSIGLHRNAAAVKVPIKYLDELLAEHDAARRIAELLRPGMICCTEHPGSSVVKISFNSLDDARNLHFELQRLRCK